jgi:hypothetical protein
MSTNERVGPTPARGTAALLGGHLSERFTYYVLSWGEWSVLR